MVIKNLNERQNMTKECTECDKKFELFRWDDPKQEQCDEACYESFLARTDTKEYVECDTCGEKEEKDAGQCLTCGGPVNVILSAEEMEMADRFGYDY